jgi:hypothetical protein
MKLLLAVTDSEAIPAFERALREHGDRGFTVFPNVIGHGRSGLKMGDRVHPGRSSLLMTAVAEGDEAFVVDLIKAVRDQQGVAKETRIFALPAVELS